MTVAPTSYLKTLCEAAGKDFGADLAKSDASRRIDALQAKTGRGRLHERDVAKSRLFMVRHRHGGDS